MNFEDQDFAECLLAQLFAVSCDLVGQFYKKACYRRKRYPKTEDRVLPVSSMPHGRLELLEYASSVELSEMRRSLSEQPRVRACFRFEYERLVDGSKPYLVVEPVDFVFHEFIISASDTQRFARMFLLWIARDLHWQTRELDKPRDDARDFKYEDWNTWAP